MTFRTRKSIGKTLSFVLFFSILLMIASSYSNTLNSPPYLDDFNAFIYPKELHLHSLSLPSILGIAKTPFGRARFLPMVSFAINNYFWGHGGLTYFHVFNILVHLLAFLAVFWFFREVLSAEKSKDPAGNEIPGGPGGLFPLCVAAIWALSPVQTSAITYLVQRMASMEALFFTLSAACFIRARILSQKNGRPAILFYFLCVLAGLCAALSKENSAMLPVILAVIDIWFFDSTWLKKVWGVCLKTSWKVRAVAVIAIFWLTYHVFFTTLPVLLEPYSYRNFTLTGRLLTEARVVVWYMSLMLWPAPSRLSMEHDPLISTSLLSPATTLPSILFITVLIFLAIRFRKRFPAITFGIAWFFLNLVIESTIFPLELVFEHRLYLPSVGFYLSVAGLFTISLGKVSKRLPEGEFAKAACSLLLVCASVLGILTFERNCAWKNSLTIHYDSVLKAPDSSRANADYAATLGRLEQYKEAIKYAEKALKVGKKGHEAFVIAQNDISIALMAMGKYDEAIKQDQDFIKRDFKAINIDSLPNLCLDASSACVGAKRPRDAYRWVLKALGYTQSVRQLNDMHQKSLIEEGLVQVFSNFSVRDAAPSLAARFGGAKASPELLAAMVFKEHKEEAYARIILERESAKHPNDALVKAENAKFQKEDAENLAQKENWNVFNKYVRTPFSRFNFDMAVAYLVRKNSLPKFFQRIGENRIDAALKITPQSREARLLKAWYLYSDNDAESAVQTARQIIDAEPRNSNAWLALGFFLLKAQDTHGAVAAFERSLELYPGYPKRAVVEQLCKQLKTNRKTIESASLRK